ncbi:death-associated inhibitor of apoptosis 2 isoform X2 [Dendroctonus ponderosae]|uniref:death-associated inhibitor of apoptosis 2 isoform X2 n=1 Tax=Dendroctonus ponderosae TaxID=77166 RepID=UPI002035C041|nr:death-associated inhibitor of apoptosis 2 isoform X2 [Dendroctonus ponderosae]
MNLEQNRLETFNDWPADAPVSSERIARAGFFYTKRDYQVECFACGMNLSEWNYGDQVMARHRALNPQCPFVLSSTSSGNVPAVDQLRTVPSTSSLDYRNEEVRLSSFVNWPKPDIVTPEDLARAGFYSLRTSDNTKCAFCHGVVRAWEPNDIPDVEHKRHFPMCPFVTSIINPRLESSRTPGHRPEQEATFKNVNLIGDTVTGSLNELGVQKHNGPKRADFGTIESRLRSFASWSPHLIQTPDVLAQAGFYYEGLGDQVRCFHCDGGLRNWDPDDDPWTEHARWFPRCSFVNLVKGQEFVTACQIDTGLSPSTTSSDNEATSEFPESPTVSLPARPTSAESAIRQCAAQSSNKASRHLKRKCDEVLDVIGKRLAVPLNNGDKFFDVEKAWASKLRDLNPKQAVHAEKFINDVFYEAHLGNLNRSCLLQIQQENSRIIQPPFVSQLPFNSQPSINTQQSSHSQP